MRSKPFIPISITCRCWRRDRCSIGLEPIINVSTSLLLLLLLPDPLLLTRLSVAFNCLFPALFPALGFEMEIRFYKTLGYALRFQRECRCMISQGLILKLFVRSCADRLRMNWLRFRPLINKCPASKSFSFPSHQGAINLYFHTQSKKNPLETLYWDSKAISSPTFSLQRARFAIKSFIFECMR